jgi:hypothetical protein
MPDLYLQLYYSLMFFGKREKAFFENSFQCLINKIHAIVSKARDFPTEFLPAFGLRCSGHQMGIATLLRLKQQRGKVTRKNDKSRRGGTRKNSRR